MQVKAILTVLVPTFITRLTLILIGLFK